MLILAACFFWLSVCTAQSPVTSTISAQSLDVLLQDYAYRAFVRPRTGIPFEGNVPSNLSGIKITAMRLRSGSLFTRGVKMYNEFHIPVGVIETPYVQRLVLVYQNLGNWSLVFYPLIGYTYLSPLLGLLAYDGTNLSATNLPNLDMRASGNPISIKFSDIKSVQNGSVPKCVWFDLKGSVSFTNVAAGNVCSTTRQGHFSIVVESTTTPAPSPAPQGGPNKPSNEKKNNSKVWIILGSVLGGFVLLILLGLLAMWVVKCRRKKKLQRMEKAAEAGEGLRMTTVGNAKAPSATVTRTQPNLENEYVP